MLIEKSNYTNNLKTMDFWFVVVNWPHVACCGTAVWGWSKWWKECLCCCQTLWKHQALRLVCRMFIGKWSQRKGKRRIKGSEDAPGQIWAIRNKFFNAKENCTCAGKRQLLTLSKIEVIPWGEYNHITYVVNKMRIVNISKHWLQI